MYAHCWNSNNNNNTFVSYNVPVLLLVIINSYNIIINSNKNKINTHKKFGLNDNKELKVEQGDTL